LVRGTGSVICWAANAIASGSTYIGSSNNFGGLGKKSGAK
jgi:hypothetical protein